MFAARSAAHPARVENASSSSAARAQPLDQVRSAPPSRGWSFGHLAIGQPDGAHERAADRLAQHMIDRTAPPAGCEFCPGSETESLLTAAPAGVHVALKSAGRPLDGATRAFFEPQLGLDLGGVRVHDDARAGQSANAVAARAYSVGSDVVFGPGEYRPGATDGRTLIAHELAHVAMDGRGSGPPRLRRTPCPSCHKPKGTQAVNVEPLTGDAGFYLPPDEDAREFVTYLRAGFYWNEYRGGKRTQVRAVHHYDYNGTSQIVGYVLNFDNPQGSNFPQPVVTIDIYGNVLDETATDRQAIESVISPIDFIGPALLARPVIGAGRAIVGGALRTAPRIGAGLASTARNLAFTARIRGSSFLGASMRASANFESMAAEAVTSSQVVRAGGELTFGSSQAARVTPSITSPAPTFTAPTVTPSAVTTSATRAATTDELFGEISSEMGGFEAPGTTVYRSTAAAAAAGRALRLETAQRPGFQTHSTASSVRRQFGISGQQWQSAHVLPQAVYRALRARGITASTTGARMSEGRALTNLLPTPAHQAFDRGWVGQWQAAEAAGQTIRARDVYNWVSRAINAVDDSVINAATKGAIQDRLRQELFSEFGLSPDDIIVP